MKQEVGSMQPRISVLDEITVGKIAAGEVVERPASVVKELIENSLDAGSSRLEIEIKSGGKEYIRISDNGQGMHQEDVPLAFTRYATSKIRTAADLETVGTLGFRGEALASIAAVSRVEMHTRRSDQPTGTRILINGGKQEKLEPVGTPPGTTVIVRDLFYNTPARYRFLKGTATEKRYIAQCVINQALANPGVAFSLTTDGSSYLKTSGREGLLGSILSVYGQDIARKMVSIEYNEAGIRVCGYVGTPEIAKGRYSHLNVFVNNRHVENGLLISAVRKGYGDLLPARRYPVAVIKVEINPLLVDVNVHPAKTQVRFKDDNTVYRAVVRAVRAALQQADLTIGLDNRSDSQSKNKTSQQKMDQPVPARMQDHGKRADYQPKLETGLPEWREETAAATDSPISSETRRYGLTSTGDREDGPGKTAREMTGFLSELTSFRIIGQVSALYILVETKNHLGIIEQHAAHERILFDWLTQTAESNRRPDSQALLIPREINVGPIAEDDIHNCILELQNLGFDIEMPGRGTVVLKAVPVEISTHQPAEELLVTVNSLLHGKTGDGNILARRKTRLTYLACRSAIKAGEELTAGEMRSLVENLKETAHPFTCPHGRPTMMEISWQQLAARFGR